MDDNEEEIGRLSTTMDKDENIQVAFLKVNGKSYPVFEGLNLIGRSPHIHINIPRMEVSKQHAVLTIIKGGKHYISDLKSTNGTKCDKVNLRPYSLYEVYHNVVIEFGDLTAKYEIIDQIGPTSLMKHKVGQITQSQSESFYQASTQNISNKVTSSPIHESTMENIHEVATQILDVGNMSNIDNSVKSRLTINEIDETIYNNTLRNSMGVSAVMNDSDNESIDLLTGLNTSETQNNNQVNNGASEDSNQSSKDSETRISEPKQESPNTTISIEDSETDIDNDSDSDDYIHTSQLQRRVSYRFNSIDEEDNESQVHTSQLKKRVRNRILSSQSTTDDETDIEISNSPKRQKLVEKHTALTDLDDSDFIPATQDIQPINKSQNKQKSICKEFILTELAEEVQENSNQHLSGELAECSKKNIPINTSENNTLVTKSINNSSKPSNTINTSQKASTSKELNSAEIEELLGSASGPPKKINTSQKPSTSKELNSAEMEALAHESMLSEFSMDALILSATEDLQEKMQLEHSLSSTDKNKEIVTFAQTKEDELYKMPTQKLLDNLHKTDKIPPETDVSDLDNADVFLHPTQKLGQRRSHTTSESVKAKNSENPILNYQKNEKKLAENEKTDNEELNHNGENYEDIYLACTQKLIADSNETNNILKPKEISTENLTDNTDDECIVVIDNLSDDSDELLLATQKLVHKEDNDLLDENVNKNEEEKNNDDIFFASTQKLISTLCNSKKETVETNKEPKPEENVTDHPLNPNDDVYSEETQILSQQYGNNHENNFATCKQTPNVSEKNVNLDSNLTHKPEKLLEYPVEEISEDVFLMATQPNSNVISNSAEPVLQNNVTVNQNKEHEMSKSTDEKLRENVIVDKEDIYFIVPNHKMGDSNETDEVQIKESSVVSVSHHNAECFDDDVYDKPTQQLLASNIEQAKKAETSVGVSQHNLKCLVEDDDVFDMPTQQLSTSNAKSDPDTSKSMETSVNTVPQHNVQCLVEDDDVFDMPTQQLSSSHAKSDPSTPKTMATSVNTMSQHNVQCLVEHDDVFDMPTQHLSTSNAKSVPDTSKTTDTSIDIELQHNVQGLVEDQDVFDMPTQQLSISNAKSVPDTSKTTETSVDIVSRHNVQCLVEGNDVFDMPTQRFSSNNDKSVPDTSETTENSVDKVLQHNVQYLVEDDDVFDMPTQQLSTNNAESVLYTPKITESLVGTVSQHNAQPLIENDDVFNKPTQQLSINNATLVPVTAKIIEIVDTVSQRNEECPINDDDVFDKPTQQFTTNNTVLVPDTTNTSPKKYYETTQKLIAELDDFTQMEVTFPSQNVTLIPDDKKRPANPLSSLIGPETQLDTQSIEEGNSESNDSIGKFQDSSSDLQPSNSRRSKISSNKRVSDSSSKKKSGRPPKRRRTSNKDGENEKDSPEKKTNKSSKYDKNEEDSSEKLMNSEAQSSTITNLQTSRTRKTKKSSKSDENEKDSSEKLMNNESQNMSLPYLPTSRTRKTKKSSKSDENEKDSSEKLMNNESQNMSLPYLPMSRTRKTKKSSNYDENEEDPPEKLMTNEAQNSNVCNLETSRTRKTRKSRKSDEKEENSSEKLMSSEAQNLSILTSQKSKTRKTKKSSKSDENEEDSSEKLMTSEAQNVTLLNLQTSKTSKKQKTGKEIEAVVTVKVRDRKSMVTVEVEDSTTENAEQRLNNNLTGRRKTNKRKQPDSESSFQDRTDTSTDTLESDVSRLSSNRRKSKATENSIVNVAFTHMDNPQLNSFVKTLGGNIVDSVDDCTVVVTENVKRTQKLLTAIGQGKPVCSPQWIRDSKKNGEFLDPWQYILKDAEAEAKWEFELKESILRATRSKLFANYVVHIMWDDRVEVLKAAIGSCGGKCVLRMPTKDCPERNNYIIVSPRENQKKYLQVLKKKPDAKVVDIEAIFDGILRQELRLDKFSIL
ncbi:mediator of DNA damage checkpoint protein 1 isoform X2 [Aethina tumida]|uniref:mediator of DNA damage checkpoint protein 1 isoform X2 n=1 Tax=Aethina tumida TaxID=116153 RepID=UPI002148B953|nr:mediator of DNA damage checkpoint protein 1 isoform X2 [Aethina tumida]